MDPERTETSVEMAAEPAERCAHSGLTGVRPWLPSLLSVGEWVFLRLFSSLTFPTISSQTSAGSMEEDCHCRSDDDMFFMQLCEFILRRYMRTRAKISLDSSPLRCGSQKLDPGAPQEVSQQWGI